MPTAATMLAFVGTSVALIVVPGPNLLYIVNRSASHGRRAGLVSAAGVETATLVHIAAAVLGLSAVILASRPVYVAITLVGAGYLCRLAIQAWRDTGHHRAAEVGSPKRAYWDGVLVNLLNPKVTLFFLAFLPQFVQHDVGFREAQGQMLVLGGVFFLLGLTLDVCYAVGGAALGNRLARWRPRRYVTAAVYLVLAGYALVDLAATR